ncbi:hypothetical protein [Streptomyces spectabilis]|uniref:Uncharacterized protein n=1 Tax=Streptomyces spectabilis TaxID=68270 RepID=A0A5P2XJK1_STRST|nr:hypothetical protein [Streptomyces spectabilis]MBB5102332.1 hypothetical protein [Streptomyces spectabilis]MCI3907380.1 hypothetical protein [Streptomyces spectabilis]QEV65217.1 hypothetical protein CP982_39880 [Streptomyces spectabilis]
MSDAQRGPVGPGAAATAADRALGVVRGYAARDAVAVTGALARAGEAEQRQTYAVLGGLLRSTLAIVQLTDRELRTREVVRLADEVAAVAPADHEFTVTEAVRAWARGDREGLRSAHADDPLGDIHVTAVLTVLLGLTLWGREAFLDVLTAYEHVARTLPVPPEG